MRFSDFFLLSWILEANEQGNLEKEPSVIAYIITFILMYFPIILLTSLILTILKIDTYFLIFKIVTIGYCILFLIFVIFNIIFRLKK